MTTVTPRAETPQASAVQPVATDPAAQVSEQPKADVSAKYLELARLEKARRKEAEGYKAKEQGWLTERQQLEAKIKEYESSHIPRSRLEQNAYDVFRNELKWDDQRILNLLMNPPTQEAQELMALKAELQSLKDGQQKQMSTIEEQNAKQRENAINQIRSKAQSLKGPDYEMIEKNDAYEAVVQLVVDTWDNEGRAISEEEAAREIEEHLLEEALRLAQIEKVKTKLTPEAPAQGTKQQPGIRTLTNNAVPPASPDGRKLTARERAIRAFMGEKTS